MPVPNLQALVVLSFLALAACSSSGDGEVSSRPDLTSPPGEMATQRLVLVKGVSGDIAGKAIGNISLATEGAGVLVRVDLRNAPPGKHVLTLNENADCSAEDVNGVEVAAANAGAPWGPDETQVRMPALQVADDGAVKAEFLVRGLTISDTRSRSFVITAGDKRIACGLAN